MGIVKTKPVLTAKALVAGTLSLARMQPKCIYPSLWAATPHMVVPCCALSCHCFGGNQGMGDADHANSYGIYFPGLSPPL